LAAAIARLFLLAIPDVILRFTLHATAVVAPGFDSLSALLEAARRGESHCAPASELVLPAPAALPANERRRASQAVRLALACIDQVMAGLPFDPSALRSVFATDEGTGEICSRMLESLTTTREISPLVFSNSVLNAPAGYFSIACHNRQPSTVVSLGEESFASGLLCALTEASATSQPVLLVSYDPALTSPLDELLPLTEPLATAWVISSAGQPVAGPVLGCGEIEVVAAPEMPPPAWRPAWLPAAWSGHSCARGLAALGLLALPHNAQLALSLGGLQLTLRLMAEA
jgi:hypothetical protein